MSFLFLYYGSHMTHEKVLESEEKLFDYHDSQTKKKTTNGEKWEFGAAWSH